MAALARALAARHEVTVLTSRMRGQPADTVEGNVRVLRVPVFFRRELAVANFPSMLAYLPMALLRGFGLRARGAFDVVNTHFVVPTGPVGQALAAHYDVANVLSVHGGDLFDPSKRSSPHRHAWLRWTIRRLLSSATTVVGQSRDTVRHVSRIYGVDRSIDLIPLGIDRPPRVTPERDHFHLPPDAFVLVTVGRLVARKQAMQLVQALARSRLGNAHLLVVGDGPDAPAVQAAATELGVAERVHLLGQIDEDEKYRALAVADVFVSTSQHEGFGLVFLEAMAAGLPVVCYDHGGQTDFLATGRSGHVVALDDLDAFAQALVRLHTSPDERRACADRNRREVEDYFIDRCAERYEELFARAIERHARHDLAVAQGSRGP
jgi:glycosyltransferase involved in cell wall biosynthesis